MKRELIQNVKVTPYTSEDAIDRDGFLSAVLGVLVGTPTGSPTGLTVKLTVTECDTESGSYTPAADKLIPVDKALDADGSISLDTDAAAGALVNFDLDLVGCKQFIKIKVEVVCTGSPSTSCTFSAALVLGDKAYTPAQCRVEKRTKEVFTMARVYDPPKAKPAENKLERPVKERKGTTSKKTEKEQKEGEGE